VRLAQCSVSLQWARRTDLLWQYLAIQGREAAPDLRPALAVRQHDEGVS